jgi:hypothetical protein
MTRGWLPHVGVLLAATACGTDLDLGVNDAAAPYDAPCSPGLYVGKYSCDGDGDGAAQLALSTSGPIAFALVPAGADTLAVAADAALVSAMSGTSATETIAGQLDCATRKLTGTTGDVVIATSAINTTVRGGGAFTASYDDDAGTPTLTNGVLDPPAMLSSPCSWSATLQRSP